MVISKEDLVERNWRVGVFPEGRPTFSSDFDELERFVDVGGVPITIVPSGDMGYGDSAMAEDAESLRHLVQQTADDFVISSARANLALVVADAEVHVVAGDEESLRRFIGGDVETLTESVRSWIDAQRQYDMDFGVIIDLLRHYEARLLSPLRSFVE